MSLPGVWPQVLDFFDTPLVIEPSHGQLTSDAGLLPIREFDQRIGLTQTFAAALDDPRNPDLSEHTFDFCGERAACTWAANLRRGL